MKVQLSFSRDMSQIIANAASRNVEESKTFLDPDQDADDFQTLISSSLSI